MSGAKRTGTSGAHKTLAVSSGTSLPDERFCHDHRIAKDIIVRDIASTATFLASIAIVIALMLMAPKSLGFDSSHPIVEAGAAP
ncbi:hypothetical protein [Mesorhizobium sp.]|uniref:hypothetical protein n=1 Tax=Mesorhizobium sp. TaxID=1871066 RepID=UPI003BA957A9